MNQRVIIYCRLINGPESKILTELRQAIEARDDMVVAELTDNALISGRGKYAGWRKLLARLDQTDQIMVADAGDLPGKSVSDLLKILAIFRDHGVTLHLLRENIDTASTEFAVLAIVEAYRRAKLSQAIKAGQARALAVGKRIGRPQVPGHIRDRIRTCLAKGDGVRPTARKYGVSPASVVNIRQAMHFRCDG